MKKRILIIIISLLYAQLWGQSGIQNDGAIIQVDQGASIKIIGSNANFTNLQNGKVDLNGLIDLDGNWTNNSSADSLFINFDGIGKVQFTGTVAQNIGGSNSTLFENLYLNNSSGISLGYFTKVDSILSLTNTILNLDQYDLQMGSINNLTGTFGVTNMIASGNGGYFKFKPVLSTYKTLPLGDISGTNEYSRIYFYVNPSTSLGSNALISARVVNSKHLSNSSGTSYLNRYWQMSSSDITNLNANVYGFYTTADVAGVEANLTASQYVDPFWKQVNNYVSTTSNYIRLLYVNEFGDFTAGEAAVFNVSISIANEATINEGSENGSTILVTLNNGTFVAVPNVSNWQVNNLPEGVSLGSITYLTSTTVRLNLSGNRTKDYDTSISNVQVMVNSNDVNNLSSGWISDDSGFVITANNDAEVLSMLDDVDGITEGAESGEPIALTLTGGTFSSALNTGNWILNNLPSGVTYTIVRNSETSVSINLTSNTNVDYDTDITNFEVIVPESDIDDYTGSALSVNTGVTFTAVVELFTISMAMDAAPINEGSENGEVISISISGDTFEDPLTPANWTVNNLPEGVTWTNTLDRVSDNLVRITLSGNRTIDYDANITNMSVVINADQIVVYNQNAIVSTGVVFTATNDTESLTLAASTINEGSEDGATITINLTNGTFYNSLDKTKWSISNLPVGVTVGSVNYVNATQATLVLSGNATVDYDVNIDLNLLIDKSQLADISSSISGAGQLFLTADADVESIEILGSINEGEEDGSTITITLSGGVFNPALNASHFTVTNLPLGVEVGQVNYVSATVVDIILIGNASVDYDVNITNTTVVVDSLAFSESNGDISDNSGVTFVAIDEPATISLSSPVIIESNENGQTITALLQQDNFTSLVANTNFFVHNLPSGVSIGGHSFTVNELEITLLGTRNADFDTDIDSVYVEVLSSGLTQHNYDVLSDSITISATNDPENLSIVTQSISEQSEDGSVVSVVITGGTFAPLVTQANWSITNGPVGVSIASLNRVSADTVKVTLSGNASVDYDSDISLGLLLESSEFDDYNGVDYEVNGGVTFIATLEPIAMTIENNGSLTINEGSEDGAEILVTLENDEFVTILNQSDWLVSHLPFGVSVDTIIRQITNNEAIVKLKGNSIIDYDQNIDSVNIDILGSQFLNQNVDLSANSGVLITANNDTELISFVLTEINERAEDQSEILVNLLGGTFISSLNLNSWNILGQPSGVTIGSVTLNSSTQALITLLGTSDSDFDSDITSVSLTISADQVDDHPTSDGNLEASGNVTFKAIVESLSYQIPVGTLTEANVNESYIELSLIGDEFIDYALEIENFTLNNAPDGVTIGAIEYVDESHVNVRLSYDRTDFDLNYNNVTLTLNGNEIKSGANIATNSFVIEAVIELPFIELSDNGLVEGSESSGYITVKLYEDEFKASLNSNNWQVDNLPEGITLNSLSKIDSVTVNIILQGNRTKDYDFDLTNAQVTILATELVAGLSDVTASSGVIFIAFDDNEELSLSNMEITEGEEDGKIITINLSGGTINNSIAPESWQFENLPTGVQVTNVTVINNSIATLELMGNRTGDYDVDIPNFKVKIPASDISDIQVGYLEASTGVSFVANNEQLTTSVNQIGEENLNGTTLFVSLTDDKFKDNSLTINSFELANAINGLSIESVSFINDTAASVTLLFDNHDFDTDISIQIEVDSSELFGVTNLISDTILLVANNDNETIAMNSDVDGIFEGEEAGEIISITLIGGTFVNPLSTENWEVAGLPTGVTHSLSYIGLHEVQVELLTNSTEDYDIDITNFSITIPAIDVADYDGSNFTLTDSITFIAYNESLSIAASLNEANLNGSLLTINLLNEEFLDSGLEVSNFVLNNAPIGLSIASVTYLNETQANITLVFDNTDFDQDVTDFYVMVNSLELRGQSDLNSSSLTITSVVELENIIISHVGLTEENLDSSLVLMETKFVKFADTELASSSFTLNNAPNGCIINSVTYINDSTASIVLGFVYSDFDSDKIISITVSSIELTVNSSITSNNLTIQATNDAELLTLASDRDLIERNEDGAIITVSLNGGNFIQSAGFINWVVLNLPDSVETTDFTWVNDTLVHFQLSGNSVNDFDTDLDVSLSVPATSVSDISDNVLNSSSFKIYAINDPEIITMSDDGEILEGAENGEQITINLTGGTFSNTFKTEAVSITNLPAGVELGAVTLETNTQLKLTLVGNRTGDYDENIEAILSIQGEYINDYTNDAYYVYSGVTFMGSYELEDRVLSILVDGITEDNLSGLVIPLVIFYDQFVDSNLPLSSFVLNNAPSGVSIDSVTYLNENECQIRIAFNGIDFDTDITDFNIEILAVELVSGVNLVSANKTIVAIDESPRIAISHPSLNELNLNGAEINVSLAFDTFVDETVSISQITLNNAPLGLTVSSFTYLNSTTGKVVLNFDGTDFDADVSDFSISMGAIELNSNTQLISNNLLIIAADENGSVIASVNEQAIETNLHGFTITMQLVGETFINNSLSPISFLLIDKPKGVSVSEVIYMTDQLAHLVLVYKGNDFDTDFNLKIQIDGSELSGNISLVSNSILIQAINDSESITLLTAENIIEGIEEDVLISVKILGGTFVDTLHVSAWKLNNLPPAIVIDTIELVSLTEANIKLKRTSIIDYDKDRLVSLEIDESQIDDFAGNGIQASNKITFYAIDEKPEVIIKNPNLTENDLDAQVIDLELAEMQFLTSNLKPSDFTLVNYPTGLSIAEVTYYHEKYAQLTLSFDFTDFDTDTNCVILVNQALLSIAESKQSNSLPILAINDPESFSIADDGEIIEGSEDGEIISLMLNGGTFHKTIDYSDWLFNNLPQGVAISSGNLINDTLIEFSLLGNTVDDYDANLTNFEIGIPQTAFDDYMGDIIYVSGGVNFIAQQENSGVEAYHSGLNENNIKGAILEIDLINAGFANELLTNSSITLNNSPAGLSVSSFTKLTDTTAQIKLDFDGTDFDEDFNSFSITISANELIPNSSVTSNYLPIAAVIEPIVLVDFDGEILEGYENEEIIIISLFSGNFVENVSLDSISFNNFPVGIFAGNLSQISDTLLSIEILGNRTVDYDTDIKNINCSIEAGVFDSYLGNQLAFETPITFSAFNEQLTISSLIELNEGNLDGAEIMMKLTDDKFLDAEIEPSSITLVNVPIGLVLQSTNYVNDTTANLILSYNGVDILNDIANFQISISESELHGVNDLISNELTIYEGVGINEISNWEIKVYSKQEFVYITIAEFIKNWESSSVLIYDSQAKLVYNSKLNKLKTNIIELDVHTGNYFIKVSIDGHEFINKVFVSAK